MFKAVKTKISNYLSPIFENKSNENQQTVTSSSSFYRKRSSNEASDSSPVPGKRRKSENVNTRSPMKLIEALGLGGFFTKQANENMNFINLTSQSEPLPSVSEITIEDNRNKQGRRKILSATRRREHYRVPLSQLSNTTLLDLTNIDDDDLDVGVPEDRNITKSAKDLTVSFNMNQSCISPTSDLKITKVAVDLTGESKVQSNSSSVNSQVPPNLIGPLARKTTGSFLHESIRLDEKTRYKTLLAHFTNIHLPEYSESISPMLSKANKKKTNTDSVTTVSSSSWFGKKHDGKPVFVDLTDSGDELVSKQTEEKPQRKLFFHELLSRSQSKLAILPDSFQTIETIETIEIPSVEPTITTKKVDNALLDTDWIQKWRDTIDPVKLERERQIKEEELRKEVIKRKQKEDFEELQNRIKETAKVNEFIELTDDMKRKVKKALGPGNSRDVFVEGFNAEITRADIATLRESTWLNDEVVNFYFNLMKERSEKEEGLPKVHVFNTFFYPKIVKTGHSGVKRWTRKIDIFSYDLILVPVHLGMHWCLAVVDMKGKQIAYYDSLKGNNPQCIVALKKYLNDESKDKKKCDFNFNGWTEVMPKEIPEQMNGCDCGAFMCKYAEYKSRNAKFTFTQANMPYFRKRMIYEIISKKLL